MTSEPAFASFKPGDLLLGKYRVERVLGAGGMGMVVAAMHVELGQRVAVKFLNPLVLHSADAEARFTREARASVRIKSDHVARVIDVGRLDNGAPYMVMEYLEGEDLAARLDRGPVPIEEAVNYLVQACDAMSEAHLEGIVHRDLKPANLFLVARKDGSFSIKVLDFGISKLIMPSAEEASLTKTATVMGSPLYMSPEQMRSARDVDLRADLWSLGVILFELISGRTPFTGQTFPELVSAVLTDPTPSLRQLCPEVPLELEHAVLRCLEKTPERRFQSAAELASAILPFGSRLSHPSFPVRSNAAGVSGAGKTESVAPAAGSGTLLSPRAQGAPDAGSSTTSPSTRSVSTVRRGRLLGVRSLVILGGVALLGLAALRMFTRSTGDAHVPAAGSVTREVPARVEPLPAATAPVPASAPPPAASESPPTPAVTPSAIAKTAAPEGSVAPRLANAVPSRPAPARAVGATPAPVASESRRNLTLKIELK